MVFHAHEFNGPANECYARAEHLDPKDPRWPHLHGISLSIEQPEAALPELRRAAELCGDSPSAPRLRLGNVLLTLGKIDEAEACFRRVLQHDPGNPYAFLGLGKVNVGRGNLTEAVNNLSQSVADRRTLKASATLLGTIDQQLGKGAEAEREVREARALPTDPPPDDPFLREARNLRTGKFADFDRAVALRTGGRIADAVVLLQRTVLDYPDAYDSWSELGETLLEARDPEGAEPAFRTAIRLNPSFPEIHNELGLCLLRQEHDLEAAASFKHTIALKPEHAEAHYNLGLCLRRQGSLAEAAEEFRAAVGFRSELSRGYYQLGAVLVEMGRIDEAREPLRHALRVEPGLTDAERLLKKIGGARQSTRPSTSRD